MKINDQSEHVLSSKDINSSSNILFLIICINLIVVDKHMDQRVFYGFLERVGGSGSYQKIAISLWSALMMIMGFIIFFLPFLFYQGNYQCPDGIQNCKDYVCSLPSDQRAQFIHDDLFSLASKFGDYRCDNNAELDRLQSFIYLGGVVGVLIGTFTNEVTTKRRIMIITVGFSIFGLILAVFGNTFLVATIGLFISTASCAIQQELIQCIIVETVSQQVRGQHIIMTSIFFSIGVALNGIIFYYLKNAITFMLIMIPMLGILLLILIFYIEETPFDLITNFTPEESLAALQKIAAANGRQHEHKITLLELDNAKREYQQNQEKHEHTSISVLDLFRFASLRNLTIVSLVLHYVTSFQFAAPGIAIRNYSLSIYTNSVMIGIAEIIGAIVCYFTIDYCARKRMMYISQAICFCTSLPLFIFLSCSDGKCSEFAQILQSVGLAIFRFAATISFNFFYAQQYEAFPNQIRGLALQFICTPSYFATVTVPQIITFCARTGISIMSTFILCTVVIGIMTICLPETFGTPPPEMIEELKYEHHQVANIEPHQQEKIKET